MPFKYLQKACPIELIPKGFSRVLRLLLLLLLHLPASVHATLSDLHPAKRYPSEMALASAAVLYLNDSVDG